MFQKVFLIWKGFFFKKRKVFLPILLEIVT